MNGKKEYGDYQTPEYFAKEVCKFLKDEKHLEPKYIIEPTCGVGAFIEGSLIFDAEMIYGVEINEEYCDKCIDNIHDERVKIFNADFFGFEYEKIINEKDDILILGNPPWVTNSALSQLNSQNLPLKNNFKGLKGMDAITGASNFDICEYMILYLISLLIGKKFTIAMLCKTSVARNIFENLLKRDYKFCEFEIYEIESKKIFNISASACLLLIQFSDLETSSEKCTVYDFKEKKLLSEIKYDGQGIVNESIQSIDDFLGESCFEWRKGVKHDCSKVMELQKKDEGFINGLKENINIEDKYIYPLMKSSMFKSPIISEYKKYVIVTQKKIKEDTSHIKNDAPLTWKYLMDHEEYFDKRKSSIYLNSPKFSMFGIGEYSYEEYKVGISGFYKKPVFSLLIPENNKPVMIDDTGYFISFKEYEMAYTAMLILNSEKVQDFLCNISFSDAKRPYTKKILNKIDFKKILDIVDLKYLQDTESTLNLNPFIDEKMYIIFKDFVAQNSVQKLFNL